MTTIATTRQSEVTLLHKGRGPNLFQSRSCAFRVDSQEQQLEAPDPAPDSCRIPGKSEVKVKGRCPFQADPPPAKKFMVKCETRQEMNTMFAKRLRNRRKLPPPPSTSVRKTMSRYNNNREGASLRQLQEEVEEISTKATCDMKAKERLFKHTPSRFPPSSFMSRWNPRHTDKRYLEKMVYDDPWSLPKEQRIQLQKLTGLRLKTMSTHSRLTVELGLNLKFGKDVLEPENKCTCHVQFCDHCEKSHLRRCPLHLQFLDPPQDDCKIVDNKSCPFAKNPEDMALQDIKDPVIYVSEVLRRLRAGEITEAPKPFPRKLLVDPALKKRNLHLNKTRLDDQSSMADLTKKVEKYDIGMQTDKILSDEDVEYERAKDNFSQTKPVGTDKPLILQKFDGTTLFKSYITGVDKSTQACYGAIVPFGEQAKPIVTTVAEQIISQALKEVSDETGLVEIRALKVGQMEALHYLQRKADIKVNQEIFRASAALIEESEMIQEMDAEESAEGSIAAILFANNFLGDVSFSASDQLSKQGYLGNKIHLGTYDASLNKDVPKAVHSDQLSRRILNDMMIHAMRDLEIVEMDQFKSQLVEGEYLTLTELPSRSLHELVELHDE